MGMISISLGSHCHLETLALITGHTAGSSKQGRESTFLGLRIQRVYVPGDINERGVGKFVEIP
jgi:hypothetical protein